MENHNIPTGWHEISVYEWNELKEIMDDDNRTFLEKYLDAFKFLTDSDEFDSMEVSKIYKIIGHNEWLISKPNGNHKQTIGEYSIKPFEKNTLAEWIDLDTFVKKNDVLKCCAILYKKSKEDEWNHKIWEPYEYNLEEREEFLSDFMINDIYGAFDSYSKFRKRILDTYHEAFEAAEEDYEPTEEDKQLLSEGEIQQVKKDVEEQKRKQEFSWQYLLHGLSDGDLTKHEAILNLPAIYVFNQFVMRKRFKL